MWVECKEQWVESIKLYKSDDGVAIGYHRKYSSRRGLLLRFMCYPCPKSGAKY